MGYQGDIRLMEGKDQVSTSKGRPDEFRVLAIHRKREGYVQKCVKHSFNIFRCRVKTEAEVHNIGSFAMIPFNGFPDGFQAVGVLYLGKDLHPGVPADLQAPYQELRRCCELPGLEFILCLRLGAATEELVSGDGP